MAALSEARAAWQRTAANRFLVQEDATKRAPLLASCSPSSILPSSNAAVEDLNKPIAAESIIKKPFNHWNSKLWLQQKQPNYHQYHHHMINEQQQQLDSVMEDNLFRNMAHPEKKETCMSHGDLLQNSYDVNSFLESDGHCGPDLNDPSRRSNREEKSSSSSSPRWRTAGAEELALLVARSSVDRVENCDLPWPRENNRIKKEHSNLRAPNGIIGSSFGVGRRVCRDPPKLPPENHTVAGGGGGDGCNKTRNRPARERTRVLSDDDESRAQILEALRHSQTRAREAERAAKLVCQEKERVLMLLLRQESQIFVYKQWLHRLQQLEDTNLQLLRIRECHGNTTPKLGVGSCRRMHKKPTCKA